MSRDFLVDLGIVVGMAIFHTWASAFSVPPDGVPWGLALVVSIPALSTLLLRRDHPWLAFVVLEAVTIVLVDRQFEIGPLNLAILVALYSVAAASRPWGSFAALGLAMAYPIARLMHLDWPFHQGLIMFVGELVEHSMVIAWGWAVRVNRQRSGQIRQTLELLDQARDQLAADAAVVERARLAREFHDIVSHNLVVVALRSGVARALVDRDPEHARDTLAELERSSRSAQGQMRQLLGAWRDGNGRFTDVEPAPGAVEEQQRRPAPTLERLDELVDTARCSGVIWNVERRGEVRELSQGIEMTAYRIVQEAVTNVLKHGGLGHARVVLDYGNAELSIEVANQANGSAGQLPESPRCGGSHPDPDEDFPTSGQGLIGLRERVAVLGGTLTAHPVPHGFYLSAVLPCQN